MMEVETKLWEFKEEVEIMEEEVEIMEEEEEEEEEEGALQTRESKKSLDHGHQDGHGHVNGGEEELKADEEHSSVFFDPSKVSDHVTEVCAENGVTEVMQFCAQKEEANEISSPKGKEDLETQENANAQATNYSPNNSKLENGSHSNGSHEISNGSETMTHANGKAGLKLIATIDENKSNLASFNILDLSNGSMGRTNVHEIEVENDEHVTTGKVNIEEYDLEKILDEQETHDLYCPNCNSCITQRVILKKRKRTVRQTGREEPPKKPQIAELPADAPSHPVPESHEQESPDIFRCLSCFSFFIPTGCGFNIFRIFGRTEANQEVQVQHPPASGEMSQSENCGSWLLSCFQPGDSPKKVDADSAKTPLLSDTQSSSVTTTSIAASTSSVHSHGTIVKPEQSKKPLQAESSSQLKTTTSTTATTTTTATASTSSQTSSATGFFQKEVIEVVTGQQVVVNNSKIPLTKPAGGAVTDATHLIGKEESIIERGYNPTSPIHPTVDPAAPIHLALLVSDDATTVNPPVPTSEQRDEWDILKAIVYGGLVESVTSLSIVAAAAASGAKTLDIFIMGIANLIGGLPLIFYNIADLRNCGDVGENDERVGHYWSQLGRRSKFRLHMVLALISYILFGLLPPVLYGLSFRKSNNRENKMMAVAAASFACIALLALGKAHVKRPRTYFKTLMYYLMIGVSASGLSYVTGVLITRLLVHFGLIDQGASAAPAPPSLLFPHAVGAEASTWASF